MRTFVSFVKALCLLSIGGLLGSLVTFIRLDHEPPHDLRGCLSRMGLRTFRDTAGVKYACDEKGRFVSIDDDERTVRALFAERDRVPSQPGLGPASR